jgi:hypothetical protein
MKTNIWILTIITLLASCTSGGKLQESNNKLFSFVLLADTRNYTGDNKDYFRGACEAIKEIDTFQFIISPGDIDPPDSVLYTIHKYIGKDITWYPIVGNHEAETNSDMVWLRNYNKDGQTLPYIVNPGPEPCKETTYSFDYENTHFVILNEYCTDTCDDCTKGFIPDILYTWLQNDLQTTKKKNILVIGHEPAYPLPDIESQRLRHANDCLNQHPENRDKFVKLLQENNVIAYIVGHTHNYSIAKINKLWHVDVGHARGIGDKGSRSTFVKVNISSSEISYETHRLNIGTGKYEITDTGALD